jgi:menaquinone-dependent protoporphyrinogen oxidase
MKKKVLITYSSRTGFTAGIAETISQTLYESGIQAESINMEDVKDLSAYSAVIAGSAIQDRQWLPEAISFMETHQQSLKTKQVALFSVCMTLAMLQSEKYLPGIKEWIEPVRKIVKPVSEGYFAGGLDLNKIPRSGDRLKFRLSILFGVWKEGDHRDYNAIKLWAKGLIPLLEISN